MRSVHGRTATAVVVFVYYVEKKNIEYNNVYYMDILHTRKCVFRAAIKCMPFS